MAMENSKSVEVVLRAILDRNMTKQEVDKTVKEVQEKLKSNPVKMKVAFDEKEMQESKTHYFRQLKDIENKIKNKYKNLGTIKTTVDKNEKGEIQKVTATIKKQNGELEKKIYQLKQIKTLQGKTKEAFVNTSSQNITDDKAKQEMQAALATNAKKRIERTMQWEKNQADAINKYKDQQYQKEQNRIKDIQEAHKQALSQNKKFDEQRMSSQQKVAEFQAKMQNNISKINSVHGDFLSGKQKQDLANFERKIMSVSAKTPNLTHETKMLTLQYDRLSQMITRVASAKKKESDARARGASKAELQRLKHEVEQLEKVEKAERKILEFKTKQQNSIGKLTNENGRFITADQNRQLGLYQQKLNNLSATMPNLEHHLRMMSTEYTNLSGSIRSSTKATTDMNTAHGQALKMDRQRTESLQDFQAKMATNLNQLKNGAGKFLNREDARNLELFEQRINGFTDRMPNFNRQMAQANIQFRDFNSRAQMASRASMKLGDALKQAFLKFPLWLGTATIVMGVINVFKDAITYVKEMDKALTDLSKVVNFSSEELDGMKDSAIQLGKELGKSGVEIMKAFAEFGRVKKVKEDIIELSRVKNAPLYGDI